MGNTISVDKHSSTLDDILQLNPRLLGTAKFEGSSPPEVTHHLKIWKFYEEDQKSKVVNHMPLNLSIIKNSPIQFAQNCCYLGLVVISTGSSSRITGVNEATRDTLISATRSLSPRGLRTSLCESKKTERQRILDFQLYVLNGKIASPHLKSHTFIKCFQLQKLILSSNQVLPIFFGGGVIRGKKLQKGSVIQLNLEDELINSSDLRQFADNIGIFKQICRPSSLPAIINLLKVVSTPLIQISNPEKKVTSPPSLPIANLKIKPPMLNLALKPFEEARYQQIQEEITQGVINFDIRATHRHQLKMEHCQNQCSQIVEGLYVSGEKVAKDLQILKKNNIQYVVNCAADYCENWFQKQGITYMSFFLKDSQTQSIECLFYRVIEFIQNALSKKKGVLVHCIQGISRSITMIIAYVMFSMKHDYKKAEAFVKQRRHVASPNNGFMVELIQFYKRLYEEYESLIVPRVFLISSHCKETPSLVTARLLKYPLFDKKKNVGLDCRGAYIIQTPHKLYIWFGQKCSGSRRQHYEKYAKQYVQLLQKYQRAPLSVQVLTEGTNDQHLFQLWKMSPSYEYQNHEYNNLFVSIEQGNQGLRPGANRKMFSSEIQQQEQQKPVKQKLFIYPDHSRGLGVFEREDLAYISLLVQEKQNEVRIYVWRDGSLYLSKEEQEEYINKVIQKHYPNENPTIREEECNNESEEFIDCFQ